MNEPLSLYRHRRALSLRLMKVPYAHIAEELGITREQASWAVKRCLKNLKSGEYVLGNFGGIVNKGKDS